MPTGASPEKDFYAAVWEIVLSAAAMDYQLNKIIILAFDLRHSAMLEPMIASVDANRKIEALKNFFKQITTESWRKPILRYCDLFERANKYRNIAAHSTIRDTNGQLQLWSPAAGKILNSIDFKNKTMKGITIEKLHEEIEQTRKTFALGEEIITNLRKAQVKREKQRSEDQS